MILIHLLTNISQEWMEQTASFMLWIMAGLRVTIQESFSSFQMSIFIWEEELMFGVIQSD